MRKYLTLLILLAATTTLSGQTATEIIAKHRKATGADFRKDIQSMFMSVSVENTTGGVVPMNMYIERPDKVSIKVEFMGQKMIMVQNGSEFWMINPMMGTDPVPIPENQKGQLTQALDDMDGQYADYLEHPENYQYLGTVPLNGIDHHKVKVMNHPSAGEAVVFFDTNTFYAVR